MLGMFTLIALGFLVLIFNPAIPITREVTDAAGATTTVHGAFALGTSGEPILDGFRAIFGSSAAKVLALIAVAGLIASFHAIIFAYGRQIFSLSRAGYFPHFLSVTHGTHKTPNVALIAGGLLGLAVMLVVWFTMGGEAAGSFIGGVLLNMAVFGAMFSYLLQGLTFIQLRRRFPNIERPYRSPFGVLGAALTVIIALVTIGFQLADPLYRTGVIGVAIWYALAIIYFAALWTEDARLLAGGGVRSEASRRRGQGIARAKPKLHRSWPVHRTGRHSFVTRRSVRASRWIAKDWPGRTGERCRSNLDSVTSTCFPSDMQVEVLKVEQSCHMTFGALSTLNLADVRSKMPISV